MNYVLVFPCAVIAWRAFGALTDMRPSHAHHIRIGAICEAVGAVWGGGGALLGGDPLPGVALALLGAAILTPRARCAVRRPHQCEGTACCSLPTVSPKSTAAPSRVRRVS